MSNGNAVTITSGETVRFPVPSDHALAPYQQLQAVSEVPNLSDLAIGRQIIAKNPGLSAANLSSAISSYLTASGAANIIHLQFSDFIVEAGATVVFAGPVTTMVAHNFYVSGDLFAHGSLNVTCAAFGAAPSNGSEAGGGSAGGGGSIARQGPPHGESIS
jgi:hypothetical protein